MIFIILHVEINTEIDLSVNSEGGIGSAVITKTPLMSDMQMDTSSINTSATAISNLPGSTSPLKCTPPVISHLISKEDYDSSATVSVPFCLYLDN